MNEFLNPKSMLTPGVAGSMVMLISNSIVSLFPEVPFRWAIVGLSFLVGTVVFYATGLPLVQRLGLWAVNSLIIFSVGIGTSNVAANVHSQSSMSAAPAGLASVLDFIVPSAHAQTPGAAVPARAAAARVAASPVAESCEAERARLKLELAEKSHELDAMSRRLAEQGKAATAKEQARASFFNKW